MLDGTYAKVQRLSALLLLPNLARVQDAEVRAVLDALSRVLAETAQKVVDDEMDGRIPEFTPTGSADTAGDAGDVSYDANYLYRKDGTGWKRAALAAW